MGPRKEYANQMKADASATRAQAEQASKTAQEWLGFSKEDRAKRDALQDPLISWLRDITGGNKGAALTTGAPQIEEINRGSEQAKANIMNTIPPGAARQFALSQVAREAPAATARFMNTAYTGGLDKMAKIGEGAGAFSLQYGAGGMRSGDQALAGWRSSADQTAKLSEQDQAGRMAMLNFVGGLVQAAGSAATGGASGGGGSFLSSLFKKKPSSGGGGGVAPSAPWGSYHP